MIAIISLKMRNPEFEIFLSLVFLMVVIAKNDHAKNDHAVSQKISKHFN